MWIRYSKWEMVNLDRVASLVIEAVRGDGGEWKYGVFAGMTRVALLPDAFRAEAILATIEAAIVAGNQHLDISDLCCVLDSEGTANTPGGNQ